MSSWGIRFKHKFVAIFLSICPSPPPHPSPQSSLLLQKELGKYAGLQQTAVAYSNGMSLLIKRQHTKQQH